MVGVVVAAEKPGGGERGCGGGGGGEGAVVEGMVAAVTVAAVMAMEGTAMEVAEEDVSCATKYTNHETNEGYGRITAQQGEGFVRLSPLGARVPQRRRPASARLGT